MKQTILLLALIAFLSGCSIKASLKPPISIDNGGSRGGGGFCPPGQAKKGNC